MRKLNNVIIFLTRHRETLIKHKETIDHEYTYEIGQKYDYKSKIKIKYNLLTSILIPTQNAIFSR